MLFSSLFPFPAIDSRDQATIVHDLLFIIIEPSSPTFSVNFILRRSCKLFNIRCAKFVINIRFIRPNHNSSFYLIPCSIWSSPFLQYCRNKIWFSSPFHFSILFFLSSSPESFLFFALRSSNPLFSFAVGARRSRKKKLTSLVHHWVY